MLGTIEFREYKRNINVTELEYFTNKNTQLLLPVHYPNAGNVNIFTIFYIFLQDKCAKERCMYRESMGKERENLLLTKVDHEAKKP